jgi:hypothetical protein
MQGYFTELIREGEIYDDQIDWLSANKIIDLSTRAVIIVLNTL